MVVKSLNGQQTDRLRKNIAQVFTSFGFKIEIKTNLIEADFLDVTFSLIKETFLLYNKSKNNLSYINAFSNHPPSIIKCLSNSINDLLLRNSSSEEIFNNTKEDY